MFSWDNHKQYERLCLYCPMYRSRGGGSEGSWEQAVLGAKPRLSLWLLVRTLLEDPRPSFLGFLVSIAQVPVEMLVVERGSGLAVQEWSV